jgi:hypothetical protein
MFGENNSILLSCAVSTNAETRSISNAISLCCCVSSNVLLCEEMSTAQFQWKCTAEMLPATLMLTPLSVVRTLLSSVCNMKR